LGGRVLLVLISAGIAGYGHDAITTKVTFDREIVRLMISHCGSCHQEGGSAFSLMTYEAARPWAKAIGEEVLHRRMPPWGAVKGFGDFRNDKGLTEEQLELIVDWEEGGAPEGDPKDIPTTIKFPADLPVKHASNEVTVSGDREMGEIGGAVEGTVRVRLGLPGIGQRLGIDETGLAIRAFDQHGLGAQFAAVWAVRLPPNERSCYE